MHFFFVHGQNEGIYNVNPWILCEYRKNRIQKKSLNLHTSCFDSDIIFYIRWILYSTSTYIWNWVSFHTTNCKSHSPSSSLTLPLCSGEGWYSRKHCIHQSRCMIFSTYHVIHRPEESHLSNNKIKRFAENDQYW